MVPTLALSIINQITSQLETLWWHYHLGHAHAQAIQLIQNYNHVQGLDLPLQLTFVKVVSMASLTKHLFPDLALKQISLSN